MPVSPVSIGRTHDTGHGLIVNCLDCHKGAKLDLPKLIARYGADCPPKALPLKCSRCGSKRFSVTVYPLNGPQGAVSKGQG
jgi:hypothetical protein